MTSQPVTLEEVARRAGVSAGTVSRVLNGLNKENRPAIARRSDHIRRVAAEMGYRPNAAARSISRGQFRAAAFVTCGDVGVDWYPIACLNGIHVGLDDRGWRLTFTELPAEKLTDSALVPHLFRETAVDGLIVNLLPAFSKSIVPYFEAQPLPCVWLNLKRKVRAVYPDDATAATDGVRWLHAKGYRRVGYYCRRFREQPHYSVIDRFNGFLEGLRVTGLTGRRYWAPTGPGPSRFRQARDRATAFLQEFKDLDAVLCYEYGEAIPLIAAAERLGRRVPEDLEVVAFHEREVVDTSGLQVPTLIVPFYAVGLAAVTMLVELTERGDRDMPSVVVPYAGVTPA
jgi:DNA-binding LacI/PurR family transcriptional regulator